MVQVYVEMFLFLHSELRISSLKSHVHTHTLPQENTQHVGLEDLESKINDMTAGGFLLPHHFMLFWNFDSELLL